MSEHTQRTNSRQRSWQCTARLQNFRNRVYLAQRFTIEREPFPSLASSSDDFYTTPLWRGQDPTRSNTYDELASSLKLALRDLAIIIRMVTHAMRVAGARPMDQAGVDDQVIARMGTWLYEAMYRSYLRGSWPPADGLAQRARSLTGSGQSASVWQRPHPAAVPLPVWAAAGGAGAGCCRWQLQEEHRQGAGVPGPGDSARLWSWHPSSRSSLCTRCC
jgi:hypothetical protein